MKAKKLLRRAADNGALSFERIEVMILEVQEEIADWRQASRESAKRRELRAAGERVRIHELLDSLVRRSENNGATIGAINNRTADVRWELTFAKHHIDNDPVVALGCPATAAEHIARALALLDRAYSPDDASREGQAEARQIGQAIQAHDNAGPEADAQGPETQRAVDEGAAHEGRAADQ